MQAYIGMPNNFCSQVFSPELRLKFLKFSLH